MNRVLNHGMDIAPLPWGLVVLVSVSCLRHWHEKDKLVAMVSDADQGPWNFNNLLHHTSMIQSLTYLHVFIYLNIMIHVYQINGHDILWCHVNMVSKLKQQLKASAANPVASGLGWESPGTRWIMFSYTPGHPNDFQSQNASKWFKMQTYTSNHCISMTCSTSFFRIRRLAICAPSFWVSYGETVPTRSRGMSFKSAPCFRNTAPAVWFGFKPTPSFVMTALVDGLTWMRRRQPVGASLKSRKQNQIEWNICTLNSSAENFTTARKGASSGTVITWSMKGLTCHHIKQMLFQVHTSKQNCPQRLSAKIVNETWWNKSILRYAEFYRNIYYRTCSIV